MDVHPSARSEATGSSQTTFGYSPMAIRQCHPWVGVCAPTRGRCALECRIARLVSESVRYSRVLSFIMLNPDGSHLTTLYETIPARRCTPRVWGSAQDAAEDLAPPISEDDTAKQESGRGGI